MQLNLMLQQNYCSKSENSFFHINENDLGHIVEIVFPLLNVSSNALQGLLCRRKTEILTAKPICPVANNFIFLFHSITKKKY